MVQFVPDPRLIFFFGTLVLTLGSVALWAMLGRNWKAVSKAVAIALVWSISTAAIIKSGASTDTWTIDPTSKAGRVSAYDTTGRDLSLQSKTTYSWVSANFTPAATPTDLCKIEGSATRTIRVIDVRFGGTATALTVVDIFLVKRSTADTAGTFVAGTLVPHDRNDAAATAAVGHYTANPTLGTTVGSTTHRKITLPIAASAVGDPNSAVQPAGDQTMLDKPIMLRGTTDGLAVNFAGAALPAGAATWYCSITWMEEP